MLSSVRASSGQHLAQLWPLTQEALRHISISTTAENQAAPQAAAAKPAAKPAAPPPPPPPPPSPSDTMEVFVNNVPVKVPKNFTVIQACDAAGVDVPR